MALEFGGRRPVGRPAPWRCVALAGVEDHVLGLAPEPSICRLQRMHCPSSCSGIPWRLASRRAQRIPGHRAALDVDQVLVVGAGRLVLVARRLRCRWSSCSIDGVARRVVRRRGAGLRLGVAPGHDHDAVVVARLGDRLLDRVELAHRSPSAWLIASRRSALPSRSACGARSAAVGSRSVLRMRIARSASSRELPLQTTRTCPGPAPVTAERERAGARHLAAGRLPPRLVDARVGPVGGPLEVSAMRGRAGAVRRRRQACRARAKAFEAWPRKLPAKFGDRAGSRWPPGQD